jgi:S-adenosylmethionine-dependent methyltransferase
MAESVDRVREYYQIRGESEWHRLAAPFDGGVEWELHRRALAEWLPPRSRVLDVGGGPGRWAIWLAQRGHRVALGDLSPAQLEIARREIAAAGVTVEETVELDARDLSRFADGSFDAVLSMGPFYHLLESADRERAATEACRVLRVGGRLFATTMTRYAWLLSVVFEWGSSRLDDTRRMLDSGVYRNEERGRFTDGYLHHPRDVPALFEAAGFESRVLMASQGFLSQVQEQVAELQERDEPAWQALIEMAYETATDPSLLGTSGHLLYIGDRAR